MPIVAPGPGTCPCSRPGRGDMSSRGPGRWAWWRYVHSSGAGEGMSRGGGARGRACPAAGGAPGGRGRPALDRRFAVGKHGASLPHFKVERCRLNFDIRTIPEGALVGRQIHHQEPGGPRCGRHERLDRGQPAARARSPAQGPHGPAGGRRRRAAPRHRRRPGRRQRPGEHRHQGPSVDLREQRAAGAVVPGRAAGDQECPERGRAARGRLCFHRTPAAGPCRRERRRREAPARGRRLPRGAAGRPAGRPRRPQSGQRRPGKLVPGAGEVRHGPHGGRPLGQAGPGDWPRCRDPADHPGPEPPHQEQPRHHRRARRRQDRRRRGSRPADRGRRRARKPARQDADRPGPRLDGGRGEVPRRIRGAAQGCPGGNQEL